ncbi:uncharacterized protein LOC132636348 [Lycium barbarum]|uniref:uncharacterized protein LOC132636348 n=1 Tax=Lycium barbarum TaxID=112863 RepID=UPI00293E2155|nr:uncharacterized protein LOC132636348 [Lycium barbarum]
MKPNENFWTHVPSYNCSWYWNNLNKIKLGMQQWYSNDRYTLTANGKYYVNQSYLALLGHGTLVESHELIWSKIVLPKHMFILWLAYHKKLFTKDRTVGMRMQCETADCMLCEQEEIEDAKHVFVDCDWAKAVWSELMQWVEMQLPQMETRVTLSYIKQNEGGSAGCDAWSTGVLQPEDQELEKISRTKCEHQP